MLEISKTIQSWQGKVRFYFDDIQTPLGKAINLVITGLVLLSLAFFVADTYPLPDSVRAVLGVVNNLILLLFTVEYLLRLWSAERPLRYFFNLYSLIDLVVILPLIFTALDIRYIRILRWFRVLRLIRFFEGRTVFGYLTRQDSAIFARILFTLFTIIFVYSGLIYQVEHSINAEEFSTFLDAVYFSVATMTTVGYGDITPISQVGRLLAVLMILSGIALIPWQVGDLIKQLVKTSKQVETLCTNCGQETHDADARYCKICGYSLAKVGLSCELPTSQTPDSLN
ncbi:MAG: ion transporter [Pegethrix bostrychoides GSE-TBD4-15B]|jgi:voltage-gated potassium channel|uniref:Ion transporter n=1 Tax=Pegethrix bostrychoides GSE-TBD4-15B TaxID=2839662 RepID=A0A951PFG0_9CYAN|nr:ion transporter [Pegethrix bostrychoides GSE-TBD4-15B]